MKDMATEGKNILRGPLFLCACVLVFLCSPVSIGAEALPETAKLVPPETIVLVDVGNFSQLRAQFEKTSFYKLYKDPAMAGFVEDFKNKWREQVKKMDNELERTIFETGILPQGRAAIALVLNEQTKDANEPPILFIAQWGESAARIKEAVDKMVQKAIENGANRKTEDYRGVGITTITQQPSLNVSYCFVGDCLIGSANLDILQFVIAHIQGASSPSLAGDTDYTATMKAVGSNHDVDVYVNIKHIVQVAVAEDAAGKAKTTVANLGFDNVASMGLAVGLCRESNNNFSGKMFLKVDGAKKGVCRVLEMDLAAVSVPQFVSASAYSVGVLNLNIKKVYDELYGILYGFSPQLAALMQTPLVPPSPQGEPGVLLKGDVIDHLGSQIIVAQSAGKQSTGADAEASPETVVAVAVTNRGALEKSLSLFHSKVIAPGNADAKRELLGHTIYLVDVSGLLPGFAPGRKAPMQEPGAPPAAGPVMQTPKLAFTITDTHLIFGSEAAVERTIRALGSPQTATLASAAWFNKAKSFIPSAVGLAVLQDNVASSEFFWKMLKKEGAKKKNEESGAGVNVSMSSASLFPQLGLTGGESDLFNFSLLPEFEAVRKYFGLSALYGISRQDGFSFEFRDIVAGGASN